MTLAECKVLIARIVKLGHSCRLPMARQSCRAQNGRSIQRVEAFSPRLGALEMPSTSIREILFRTVQELGYDSSAIQGEIILIRDGKYAGRRFEFDGLRATWSIEGSRIDFHTESGELLRGVRVEDTTAQRRLA
jgi:hypothetical protein